MVPAILSSCYIIDQIIVIRISRLVKETEGIRARGCSHIVWETRYCGRRNATVGGSAIPGRLAAGGLLAQQARHLRG